MKKSDFDDYERRSRLYHTAFEEYDSLEITYKKFFAASDAFKRRGKVLTFSSTILSGVLLFIIGAVIVRGSPNWGTDVAFAASAAVAVLSFVNAVESPQKMSNVTYNSGQTLHRVFLEFHYFITVRLPDPDEDLEKLEAEYERLLERKHTVNETTPALGNKWYKRVKGDIEDWEPKPLTEITGEDGEFEVNNEEDEEDENRSWYSKASSYLHYPIIWVSKKVNWIARRAGY